ncbi:MAG: hypothetical protein Q8O88_06000 [bacterium]|nr:hypothetical protein [bacterium]
MGEKKGYRGDIRPPTPPPEPPSDFEKFDEEGNQIKTTEEEADAAREVSEDKEGLNKFDDDF